MSDEVLPYRIEIPDAELEDLRDRLARTRWPDAEPVGDWSQGVPLAYLRELCAYWADGYDWRRTEARLNALPQFRTEIGGLDIHFLHVRSPHEGALPLVLTHGWPGSIITTSLAQQDAGRLAGIHLNPPIAAPDPATLDDLTGAERVALADLRHAGEHESGYSAQMSTKPQTVGYALTDSLAGLAAWIVEKFASWTDSDGRPEEVLGRDAMLDDVTLYWLTRTAASSARPYWESIRQVTRLFTESAEDTVPVPTGCSIFPREVPRPSRRWAARRYPDIRHWHELDRGGHFAAWEQPELFVEEVRAFFRLVR